MLGLRTLIKNNSSFNNIVSRQAWSKQKSPYTSPNILDAYRIRTKNPLTVAKKIPLRNKEIKKGIFPNPPDKKITPTLLQMSGFLVL